MLFNNNDFGFTAVDETELGILTASVAVASTVSSDIAIKLTELQTAIAGIKSSPVSQLNRVEEKLDRILGMELQDLNKSLQSQGDNLSSVLNEVEERTNVMQGECKDKLQSVEKMILPLLMNLMKNPEKQYIHWANRSEKISTQIDKITAITRSYGV